jgi:hypothetical protein
MSASSFLSYGGVLKVVRTSGSTLNNANAGVGLASDTSLKIDNYDDYTNNHLEDNSFTFAAKNPGSWANGLKVCTIDNKADQILTITNELNPAIVVGCGVSVNITGNVPGSGSVGVFTGYLKGIVTGLTAGTASVSFADVNFNQDYIATGSLRKFTVTGSAFTNADYLSVRSFIPSGTVANFGTSVLPEFTKWDGTNVTFIVATTGNAVINSVTFTKQPTDSTRGDFEDRDPLRGTGTSGINAGTDLQIPEIDLDLRSETIVAKTRKLKAVWSPELAQDLNAYHSVDAEAELTSMLSDYVAMEIDLEILDMLINAAPATTTEYWSAEIGSVWNGLQPGSGGAFAASSFTGTAWTNMNWYQTLGQKMQKVSNRIHQLTMRGGANFAVVSPTVATILETIPGFAAGTDGDKMEFAAGVTKIGSFQNRFTVYKNPYMTENVMLMGFRGNQFLETGAVYAPYIPLIMTPLVYDPQNFTPRRGVMTRYAKKVVRPEYFGKIYIDKLNLV